MFIVGHGADAAPERGLVDEIAQQEHQHDRRAGHEQLERRDPQTPELEDDHRKGFERKPQDLGVRHLLRNRGDHQPRPDGRDDAAEFLVTRLAQASETHDLDQNRQQARGQYRQDEAQPQRPATLDRVVGDHCPGHEDRAMGQVQDPLDAEDQRESQREQRVNAAHNQSVENLLRQHPYARPRSTVKFSGCPNPSSRSPNLFSWHCSKINSIDFDITDITAIHPTCAESGENAVGRRILDSCRINSGRICSRKSVHAASRINAARRSARSFSDA